MSKGMMWGIVLVLFTVIVVLAWILFAVPAPAHAPTVEATPSADPSEPLHARVIVSTPESGAEVGKTFTVLGEAPGNWYFEASFPIKVLGGGYVLAVAVAEAHPPAGKDWMTIAQVPFTATITLDSNYSGPATLVLLRDNPSGLPENDDQLGIPIVIQ